MKNLFTLLVFVLTASIAFGQGVTTSSMKGRIMDDAKVEMIGANIMAVHTPSGTTYGTTTDVGGYYRIPNMRVGGPYTITISYTGYADQTLEDVYLRLGEPYRKSFTLSEQAIDLTDVIVVAKAGAVGENAGASTQISEEQIENLPTLNRDLNDFTRLTPQSKGSFGGGISIAGINNRYNAIYIDGAVNNDVFGLSAQGTNGGQTGISPISIDVIEQLQVVISPYDVSFGGFAGGGINAVTKSGTNEFKGTAYYFLQNEDLQGKTNQAIIDRFGGEREKTDEFTQQTYGFSIGGPIIKDKLFFFTNFEIQDDQIPAPFDGQYDGDTSVDSLAFLGDFLQEQYGYDAGDFGSKTSKLEGVKFFGKLNYNINDQHKLVLRHQYTKAEETDINGSGFRTINYANNGVFFPSTTNSSALELNSLFGSKASNNLIIGYTTVRDDRDPIGSPFPAVEIRDGQGTINFGGEAFSSANQLDQDIFTITNNFKLYKGAHTLTVGTHNEFISFYNLFIRQNFGDYTYGSLDDFLNDAGANNYDRSYSLVDDKSGDGSAAAAEFSAMQLGFYIQDEWEVSPKFTLTTGLRLDVPILTDDPSIDESFNTTTLPLLEQNYDLGGARGGEAPSGQLMWSPRVGFNYSATENLNIRGGVGIFTSRVPFVWPGGMYTNNGVTIGGLDEGDLEGDIAFIADPNNQYVNPNFAVPSGQVDLFVEDFKFPQLLRSSLAVDYNFGEGLSGSLEGIYSKTINNVIYTNINNDPTIDFNWTNGANNTDDRPIYGRDDIDEAYSAIYLGENTNEGYTYSLTAALNKVFPFGLSTSLAYTYGEAESLIEGTSSQNSSQWRGAFNTDGRNTPGYGRSDFAIGHRFVGTLNWGFDWNQEGNARTIITAFYNGQSGDPYSYVYENGVENGTFASNINNETGSTRRNRSLIYVPTNNAGDIELIDYTNDNGRVITAAEQWTSLNAFIEADDYLSTRRGEYAEKNGARSPFVHQIDVRLTQEFKLEKNRLQITFDVFNFANLLNPSWGVQYSNPFDYRILNFEGYADDGTTPLFTFTEEELGNDRFGIFNNSSRWRARLGLRYIFN